MNYILWNWLHTVKYSCDIKSSTDTSHACSWKQHCLGSNLVNQSLGKVSSLTKHRTHSIAFSKGLTSHHLTLHHHHHHSHLMFPPLTGATPVQKFPSKSLSETALFLHTVDASVISRVPPFPGGRGSCAVRLKLPYSTNTLQCDRKHWHVCLSSCTECTTYNAWMFAKIYRETN